MIFNNFEEIEIGGTHYKLKYNLKAAATLEKELGKTFVMDLLVDLEKGNTPSVLDMFTFFRFGFEEGNPKTDGWKEEDVAELFEAAVCEYSLIQLVAFCIKAYRTAGFLEFKPKKKLLPLESLEKEANKVPDVPSGA